MNRIPPAHRIDRFAGTRTRRPLRAAAILLPALAVAAGLAACGGGGGSSAPIVDRPGMPPAVGGLPALPLQRAQDARNAPIVHVGRNLHIGPDVAPSQLPDRLSDGHEDIVISYGTTRDGVGSERLIAYLTHDVLDGTPGPKPGEYIQRFDSPPPVRIAQGTSPELVDLTVRALQLINAALPADWQLRIDPEPGPADPAANDNPPHGQILIQFAPVADWPTAEYEPEGSTGLAHVLFMRPGPNSSADLPPPSIIGAAILVDHTRVTGRDRMDTLVHEIIHALGRHHPDPELFPHTIIHPNAASPDNHILYPLDREALLAVYGRLRPGTTVASLADDLGPWSDTSTHLLGEFTAAGQDVSFGVALQNGLAQPWATGPAPLTSLADNAELSGTASWSGRLVGFTPKADPVVGDADLIVGLRTLDGDLQFTELEQLSGGDAPSPNGDWTAWNDGALGYSVEVRGNTFVRTGGDDGIVTGAFLGTEHQAMGGTLQRDDLSAAFGGSR